MLYDPYNSQGGKIYLSHDDGFFSQTDDEANSLNDDKNLKAMTDCDFDISSSDDTSGNDMIYLKNNFSLNHNNFNQSVQNNQNFFVDISKKSLYADDSLLDGMDDLYIYIY